MTGILSGADVRGFYTALGVELPGWAHTEAPVRCFTDPDSHQHQDRNPSCSINLESGAFNCHACGAHGGAYDAALATGHSPREAIDLMIAHGLTERRSGDHTSHATSRARARATSPATAGQSARRARSAQAARADAQSQSNRFLHERNGGLREWIGLLRDNRELLERLRRERRWEPAMLRAMGVGYDRARITVPITDEHRSVQGVLRLRVDGSQYPKALASPGTRLGLIPHPALEPRRAVMLVEGPSDMLAARSAGLPAIAVPGANAWRAGWADALAGRDVAVVMDCDRPGRQAALRIASDLDRRGTTRVRIIDLGPDRDDGYDLSDWLTDNDHQHTVNPRAYTHDQYRRIVELADRAHTVSTGPVAMRGPATPSMTAATTHRGEGRNPGCARF